MNTIWIPIETTKEYGDIAIAVHARNHRHEVQKLIMLFKDDDQS